MYLISETTKVTPELCEAFKKLTPQLADITPPTAEHLARLIKAESTHLFIAREEETNKIVGTVTLVTCLIPTSYKGWIEDVIVDSSQRGQGLGKKLINFVHDFAQEKGIEVLFLTSHPSRVAANKLYQKVGYEQKMTNLYFRACLEDS